MNWKEFKLPLLFLAKFAVVYLGLNLLYGFYIHSYLPGPDPVTVWVTKHSEAVLSLFYSNTETTVYQERSIAALSNNDHEVLHIYEGCNGINTAIVFLAFILALGRPNKKVLWFIPAGLLVIHMFNILRISLLFYVHQSLPSIYYFSHKYLFTAFIYLAIFLLWYIWVKKIEGFRLA